MDDENTRRSAKQMDKHTDRQATSQNEQAEQKEFNLKSSSLLTKAIENQNIWHANWVKTLSFYPLGS